MGADRTESHVSAEGTRPYFTRTAYLYLVPLLVAMICLSVVILVDRKILHEERRNWEESSALKAEELTGNLSVRLERVRSLLLSLKYFFEYSEAVSGSEFRNYSISLFEDVRSVEDISVFNSTYRLLSDRDYLYRYNRNPSLRDKLLRPSSMEKALLSSAHSGKRTVVSAIVLEGDESKFYIAMPVRHRSQELVALEKVDASSLVERTVSLDDRRKYFISLRDRFGLTVWANTDTIGAGSIIELIEIGDSYWKLYLAPAALEDEVVSLPRLVLWILGTLLTIVITGLILYLERSNFQLENQVWLKTRDLRELADTLHMIVEERTKALQDTYSDLARKDKLAVMGQLATMIAHEVRNPLGVIRASTHLLKGHCPPDHDLRKYLNYIDEQVKRLESLVNTIFNFYQDRRIVLEPTEVTTIIQEALSGMRLPENVEVRRSFSPQRMMVVGDRILLRQVFANIITNAFQAMENGGLLEITGQMENGKARIKFRDTGVGIAPERLKDLFEPTVSNKPEGSGLGLAFCKQVLGQHNGQITVQTEAGKGSTFSLELFSPVETSKTEGPGGGDLHDSSADDNPSEKQPERA